MTSSSEGRPTLSSEVIKVLLDWLKEPQDDRAGRPSDMSHREIRPKSNFNTHDIKVEENASASNFELTRRAVIGGGLTGVGTLLAWPSLAGTGNLSFYYDRHIFQIIDGEHSWEIDSRWFGDRCSLRIKRNEDSISVWTIGANFPSTSSKLNIFLRISDLSSGNPLFYTHSKQLGIKDALSLRLWLRGQETLTGCRKRVFFSSCAHKATYVTGQVVSLDRDWKIALDDGIVSSEGTFRASAHAFRVEREHRAPSEAGVVVLCDGGVDLGDFWARKKFRLTTLTSEAPTRTFPLVHFAPCKVELALDCRELDRFSFSLSLGDSVRVEVSLTELEARLCLAKDEAKFEVDGLVDEERTALYYGGSQFTLRSAFPNEVFSLSTHLHRNPEFGHNFEVSGSVLPVRGLISRFAQPSLVQKIWISSDGREPDPDTEMLLAGELVISQQARVNPVVREQVCAGCSVPGKPEGINYFSTRIHQPESLLELGMEFYNFDFEDGPELSRLVPREVPGPCLVIVHFPSQHLEEDAFNEGAGCTGEAPGPKETPVGSAAAGPTRLVFEYPKALGELELTADQVLNWDSWLPQSSGLARHPALIEPPTWDKSAIEAPRGLVLQQGPDTTWRTNGHRGAIGERNVLFHVDLVTNDPFDPDESDFERRPRMVPVWTDAFIECGVVRPQPAEGMWRTLCRRINLGGDSAGSKCEVLDTASTKITVDKKDSHPVKVIEESTLRAVVRLGHDSTLCAKPFKADHMLLSQLGAWTALEGYWPKTPARAKYTDLKSKKHRITQRRTQFDKDERRGFLYPFGHRLTLVPEVNRRQHIIGDSTYSALKKKWYVVVEQPTVQTDAPRLIGGATDQTFRMPFRSVSLVESSTPNLDPPIITPITDGNPCNTYFWGQVCENQFYFNAVGIDWRGREISLKIPLLFVNDVSLIDVSSAQIEGLNAQLEVIYRDAHRDASGDGLARSFSFLDGQVVALQAGYQEGDTDFEVGRLRFEGVGQLPPSTEGLGDCDLIVDGETENTSYFYPVVEVAEVRAPTLSKATANGGGACWLSISDPDNDPSSFEIVAVKHSAATEADPNYDKINSGRYPNVSFKLPFDQNSDSTGGVSGPTPKIDAWSRIKGPLGIGEMARQSLSGISVPDASISEFRNARLDRNSYFDFKAKICGVIPLSEIVSVMGLDSTTPALLDFFNIGGDVADSTGYVYDWDTGLDSWDAGILKFGPRSSGDEAKLVITGGVLIELEENPKVTGFISGEITNFFISLEVAGNGIRADFSRIGLNAPLGEKIRFDVDIDTVTFIGPLMEFIQKLKEQLGFGDGFDVVLSAQSVTAQLGPFELPSIGFGVFSMSQISFFAGCDIYFKGNKPILFTFKFSTRDRPFSLAVALIGGRGSFLIAFDTSGVQEIAASLEFGAITEFAFGGFAHGNLYIMGGVFYSSKRVQVPDDNSKPPEQQVKLSQTVVTVEIYVRAGGSLSCYGFITVSLDVHLGLSIVQRGASSVAYGTATLTFSVKIGFFKKSFSVTFSKELPGSSSQGENQRVQATADRKSIVAFQTALSPASPFTPYSSYRKDISGYEASPAQITGGEVFAEVCDHQAETCGPSGISAMSKAQFRYYWYSFGENRRRGY